MCLYEIFCHHFSASLVLASLGNLSRLEVDEIKQGGSGQWLNLSDDQRWRKTQFLECKCCKYQKVRFKRSKGSIYNIYIERSQRPKHSWAAPWLLQNQFRKWEWPTVATIPGPSQRLSGKRLSVVSCRTTSQLSVGRTLNNLGWLCNLCNFVLCTNVTYYRLFVEVDKVTNTEEYAVSLIFAREV